MKVSNTLLFSALLVSQEVAARGFGWNNAPRYQSPANTDNECNDNQRRGFDWGDLNTGDFRNYGGFDFSGFKCENRFGKRDLLTKRTFQDKCITGRLSKGDGSRNGNGPSIAYGGSNKGFSITQFQISSTRDVDVDCIYEMEDGSTCKQTASCRAGGSTVENNQCGGAKRVRFELPKHERDDDCEIGIHQVDFDCSPPESGVPPRSRPPKPATSSKPVESSSPVVVASSSVPVPSPSSSKPATSAVPSPSSSKPVSSAVPTISFTVDVPVTSTTAGPVIASSSTPVEEEETPTPEPETPETPEPTPTPVFTPPVETTSSVVSPVILSSAPPAVSSIPPVSSVVPPPPPPPPADCPDVLPRCLSTWIFRTGCTGNDDKDCYCKQAGFTQSVQDCVNAHGDEEDIQEALKYLAGICVDYIPVNPGIITNCPDEPEATPAPSVIPSTQVSPVISSAPPLPPSETTVTEIVITSVTTCPVGETLTFDGVPTVLTAPTVSTVFITTTSTISCTKCAEKSTEAAPVVTAAPLTTTVPVIPVPVTTVIISTTVLVPCTYTTGESIGFTIPSSSTIQTLQTTVTVPQVQFITTTVTQAGTTSTVQVGLVAAPTTDAAPVPGTTFVPLITTPTGINTVVIPKTTSSATVSLFQGAGVRVGPGSAFGAAVGGFLAFLVI